MEDNQSKADTRRDAFRRSKKRWEKLQGSLTKWCAFELSTLFFDIEQHDMSSIVKKYWIIEIFGKNLKPVLRKRIPGRTSEKAVSTILQRLACRELSPRELIAVSLPDCIAPLLRVEISYPPQGTRTSIRIPAFPAYRAGRFSEDELDNLPEILPEYW